MTWLDQLDKLAKSESLLASIAPTPESPYHQQEAEAFSALFALGEPLTPVLITGAVANDTLRYDGAKWVNSHFLQNTGTSIIIGGDPGAAGASGGSPKLYLVGTLPLQMFVETTGPVDEKFWRWYTSGGDLHAGIVNDAFSVGVDWMTVVRTGVTNAIVQFPIGRLEITNSPAALIIKGSPTAVQQIQFGDSSVFATVGTRFSGGDAFLAANASQSTTAADSWTQSLGSQQSVRISMNSGGNMLFHRAASGTVTGTEAAFWGTAKMVLEMNAVNALYPGAAGGLSFGIATQPWGPLSTQGAIKFYDSAGLTQRGVISYTSGGSGLLLGTTVVLIQLDDTAFKPLSAASHTLGTAALPWGPLTFKNSAGGNISAGTGELSGGGGSSPTSVRLAFGTDNTGWQLRFAKNISGAVTDLWALEDSSGRFFPIADNTYSIGDTTHRMANVYTKQLQLFDDVTSGNPYIQWTWKNSGGTSRGGYLEATGDSVRFYSSQLSRAVLNMNYADGNITPGVAQGGQLGTTGLPWGDLIIGDGTRTIRTIISTPEIGTTSNHSFGFFTNNTSRWQITAGGNLIPITDGGPDIGVSGSARVNNIWAFTRIHCDNVITAAGYKDAANSVTLVAGAPNSGWGAPTGTTDKAAFATDTVTLIVLARHVKALIDALRGTTHNLLSA